jgi:hypothetical protein
MQDAEVSTDLWCSQCQTLKRPDEFFPSKIRGKTGTCKVCHEKPLANRKRPSHPQKRNTRLRYRYHITEDQFHNLIESQDGKCAICQRDIVQVTNMNAQVDHNHKTGEVRGVLCFNCNNGLGKFKDNPELLQSAIRYLNSKKEE